MSAKPRALFAVQPAARPITIRQFAAVAILAATTAGLTAIPLIADEPASAATTPSAATETGQRAGLELFEAKIRPVLVAKCYACHSAEAAKAGKLRRGLLLDSREGIAKGGETGPVIIAGKPEESLLIRSLEHVDDAAHMPPDEKLSDAVIADFRQWVKLGAPDPRTGPAAVVKRGMPLDEGRRLWSMIPPVRRSAPMVSRESWPRSELDRFILAKLEHRGLAPVADADRATLIRRVTFDLVGLPPDPERVDEFVGDDGPDALSRLLDELLASPRFGQRWGRHWLDSARFADSNGRDRNVFWLHAWRYRDYVIASFNSDKPYDQFVREQLAGDLLARDDSTLSPERRDELQIATGLLALGPKAFEEQKPEIFRMDVIDEQIDVIGRTILGLSIGCARCHDHKFDPIPTRDYYAIAGILRSTQPLYGHGPRGIKATQHNHTPLIAIGPKAETHGPAGLTYFDKLHELNLIQNTARSDRYRVVRRVADARNQQKQPGADVAKFQAEIDRLEAEVKDWDVKVKAAEQAFQALMDAAPELPGWAMGVRDRDMAEDCRVHIRGETTNLGDVVPRGVLQVLPNAVGELPADRSGRRQLAEWLVARDNPLTARVFVNRLWQHLFGRGIVASPDDFGVNGAPPTHPELLDWLSVEFAEHGASTKRAVRQIALSRAYQLSSEPSGASLQVDPDNTLLWRNSPRRVEVEPFRDAVLAVAGRLDLSTPTPEQLFLARLHPYRQPEFFNFDPPFKPHDIDQPYRSVYLPVVRGVLPTMFQLFDFAAPDRPVAQRDDSTVPAQSLFLLNNAWIIEQSRHAARRLLDDSSLDEDQRVQRLYRLAYGRAPTADELRDARDFLTMGDDMSSGSAAPAPSRTSPASNAASKSAPPPSSPHEARWITLVQAILGSAEFRVLR